LEKLKLLSIRFF